MARIRRTDQKSERVRFDAHIQEIGNSRSTWARKDLRMWLDEVGLSYHSLHKFRHGNAVYSLKKAQDVKDSKAVSQNLMHSNLSITDGVYGILSSQDVGEAIKNLGEKASKGGLSNAETIEKIEDLLAFLKENQA